MTPEEYDKLKYNILKKATDIKVPVTGKVVGDREREFMYESIEMNCGDSYGHFVPAFEDALKQFLGTKHAITTNSGSSANLLAFSALCSESLGDRRIKFGDEVITVAAGFPTTINPILMNGCVPVFCDVTIPEYNIDVRQLEASLSDRTRCVVIAHTLGRPFDIQTVKDFCTRNGLWLIEDCADALGAMVQGSHVGTFGDIGTLSFYPAHHITTGEGGAVFTGNAKLARIVESIRDWGRSCFCPPGHDNTCKKRFSQTHGKLPQGYDHKYVYSELGYNLKLTDVAAACGVAQMERLAGFITARRDNFRYLFHSLSCISEYLILPTFVEGMSPFGFPITLRESWGSGFAGLAEPNRRLLIEHLESCGITTRLLFGGNLTKQPYMQHRQYRIADTLAQTDRVMRDTFWIGCHPALSTEQLDHTITTIKEFFT